jgi:FdhD protein
VTQPSSRVEARVLSFSNAASVEVAREVPVETAVNVFYGGSPFAVMMTTPADLEDFAWGFSLTEGVIASVDDVVSVAVHEAAKGLELRVTLRPGLTGAKLERERNTEGRTGCGVCGIESLDALPLTPVKAARGGTVSAAAIKRALEALSGAQVLNERTHAVHAAAWCTADGAIALLREDVGRHNALDKLIGALLRARRSPLDGFLLLTSRCSFEMVEKAAAFGARTVVAISAPTSMAIERAILHDLTLVALARPDTALVFHGAERLT